MDKYIRIGDMVKFNAGRICSYYDIVGNDYPHYKRGYSPAFPEAFEENYIWKTLIGRVIDKLENHTIVEYIDDNGCKHHLVVLGTML